MFTWQETANHSYKLDANYQGQKKSIRGVVLSGPLVLEEERGRNLLKSAFIGFKRKCHRSLVKAVQNEQRVLFQAQKIHFLRLVLSSKMAPYTTPSAT
jgi:hypothetical protein